MQVVEEQSLNGMILTKYLMQFTTMQLTQLQTLLVLMEHCMQVGVQVQYI